MVSGNLFLSEQHAVSRRHAVLEDEGLCGWLYLTDQGRRVRDQIEARIQAWTREEKLID